MAHWYSSSYDGKVITFIDAIENTGNVQGRYFVGGIMGYGLTDATESVMANAKSSSDIVADAYAGCIAGHLDRINLTNPTNQGSTLTLRGTYLESSTKYAYVGAYVGNALGLTITGAVNDVAIDYSTPLCQGSNVGGIAGASTGIFINCINNAQIYAPSSNYVGGICGNLTRTGGYNVSDLQNNGKITGNSYVGGIFGRVYDYDSAKHSNTATVNFTNIENNGDVISAAEYAGGIFGYFHFEYYYSSSYNGKVIVFFNNLTNKADVTGLHYVGGIAGYGLTDATESTLSSSSSSGTITADAYAGGIAGRFEMFNITTTTNKGTRIVASGTRTVSGTQYACVGGYVGSFQKSTIIGAVNEADIDYSSTLAVGYEVGGIAGSSTSIIIDCQNSGNIYAPNASWVGGIAGQQYLTGSYDISNLVNSGDITGKSQVGGIFGYVKNKTDNKATPAYVMNYKGLNNSGNVTANESYAGGFIGQLDVSHYYSSSYNGTVSVYISESTASGNITGVSYVGGYIGSASTDSASSTVFSSNVSAVVTGNENAGDNFGYTSNFSVSS